MVAQKTGCQVRMEKGSPTTVGHVLFIKSTKSCVAHAKIAMNTSEIAVIAAELKQMMFTPHTKARNTNAEKTFQRSKAATRARNRKRPSVWIVHRV